jgi:ABC-2 type transport system permease protein
MLLLFGYAINWDVRELELVVLDQDRTTRSRDLVATFQASGYFRVVDRTWVRTAAVDAAVGRGDAGLGAGHPPGFARDLAAGPDRAGPAPAGRGRRQQRHHRLGLRRGHRAGWSREVVLRGRDLTAPIQPEVRIWYNPTLESRNMIVPGLIGVIMMTIAAMLTALTIAREWERGTMEQLVATPATRGEIILGKLIPYILIGLVGVVVTAVTGVLVFRVPFVGSVALFLGQTLLFLTGALGWACSSRPWPRASSWPPRWRSSPRCSPPCSCRVPVRDPLHAPGTPGHHLPGPARYYITATRGVMLKGVGPGAVGAVCVHDRLRRHQPAAGRHAFRKEIA